MRFTLTILSAATALAATAEFKPLYSDLPDAKHAWSVHDLNRPLPKKVTAEPGLPPSDAVILFDGTEKSFRENWCDKNGGPTKWKFVDGAMESVRAAGNICSRREFGDVQLHVEWQPPVKTNGYGQARGNSGVFVLGGFYELQVLDSYGTDPDRLEKPNYADGMAGAVYGQNPPLVNPSRPTPEWQVYDIVFHRAVFDGDRLVRPATITAFFNGVLVQDNWEYEGPTLWRFRTRNDGSTKFGRQPEKGSIQFQDHGNPVHFRNVWVREIPSRDANTVHGVFRAREGDVAKLRADTAARLYAKIGDPSAADEETLHRLAEVVGYSSAEPYVTAFRTCLAAYRAKPGDAKGIERVNKTLEVLIRAGLVREDERIAVPGKAK